MLIKGSTVLITGSGGGIGKCLLQHMVEKGAKKIYAADLSIENINVLESQYKNIVIPLKLDVTNQEDIEACRTLCSDIDILINNAGVEFATSFLSKNSIKASAIEMAVNYHGVHDLCYSFWDILKRKQASAIINMLSIASLTHIFKLGTYCASKAAAHFLTQGLREDSIDTPIKIVGIYPGYVDTMMTQNLDVEKATPEEVVLNICNEFEAGFLTIFPDSMSKELATLMNW